MLQKMLFIIWFIVLSIPLSMMMGSHTLSLNSSHNKSLQELSRQSARWSVLHFVNPDCGCSERVVKSLISRKAKSKDISEKVFVLGKNEIWVSALTLAGYETVSSSMDNFAEKYKISAVPQLVIIDESKIIVYSGGYSSKRGPASVVEDEKILHEIMSKNKTAERPIFGCVNGNENRKKSDFLGYKY